jgi:hypothetical protein
MIKKRCNLLINVNSLLISLPFFLFFWWKVAGKQAAIPSCF